MRSYPTITREGIDACIAYAAELARERVVTPSSQNWGQV